MQIEKFYYFDYTNEGNGIAEMVFSVSFEDMSVFPNDEYDSDAFTLYVAYDLNSKKYVDAAICEQGEPIHYELTESEEKFALSYIEESNLDAKLFEFYALLNDIQAAFNSEIVNRLVENVKHGSMPAMKELLHVVSVACDLSSLVNKEQKMLYDGLKYHSLWLRGAC